jgi:hypothetical protein
MTHPIQTNAANRQWQWMLAVDAVIAVGGILITVFLDSPRYDQYMQLLVTYRLGFIRRGLIGEVVSWFKDLIPLWYVYAIATAAWIVTLVLFVAVFRKVFGFSQKNLPLFVFMIGSPFFFKNFAITLGHFDIYGCLWGLVALLLPVGPFYPFIVAIGSVVLILIHHLHFLLYLPTIAFVVLVRYYAVPGFSMQKLVYGLILSAFVAAAFVSTTFLGHAAESRDAFLAYVSSRAADRIDAHSVWMWYSTIQEEIESTRDHASFTLLRLPVYAVLIFLHFPIARYLKALISALTTPTLRFITIASLAGISLCHAVIFVVAYDYARWISAWGVCMILALHAIRLMPSTLPKAVEPVHADKSDNLVLGWIVTLIPRVGVTIPF